MRKTITINDPMQVKVGDKAYFKDCYFGFTVREVDEKDKSMPFAVTTPFCYGTNWVRSSLFDHAERTVEELEWPDPHDISLHVYLGADGMKYIYNHCIVRDQEPWIVEGSMTYHSRRWMAAKFQEALPLIELELIPKERES